MNRHPSRKRRAAVSILGAVALMTGLPAVAQAAPPSALPADAGKEAMKWQPAFDYDGDGCYPTPAVGRDGRVARGLKTSGAVDGNCRDRSDLDNTNSYVRSKCNHGWCAYVYALYFEKDQASFAGGGHTHDFEHVVVWVSRDQARYVSVSAHGEYTTRAATAVEWSGTHARVVYHKGLTHSFRFAKSGEHPENHYGAWQYPTLVGWNGFPPGIREKLVNANFSPASLGIKDSTFAGELKKAKPANVPFNPNA
ncbi:NPP1 family protein [Actinosynnema sp. NPDC050801]|uniref:NPP1 family protein n=1 Tax=unclassified Actinosynnema TaxID=2637065 RepID=UPI0033D9EFA0